MTRFLTGVAAIAILAAPAYAQDSEIEADENAEIETTYEANEAELSEGSALDATLEDMSEAHSAADMFTDDHELIDTMVRSSDGESVGDVERVRFNDAGEIDAIVIETPGVAEIGGREVLVELDSYTVATVGEETFVDLTLDAAAFAELPTFEESTVSEYPLSDNPLEETDLDNDGEVDATEK